MYKVSIIVPIFNKEKYLDRGIQSILNQSLDNIQVILIDDGSTDRSREICDKYANENENIKVIHKSNEGVSAARNTGIEVADGEFIGFMDPDDTLDMDAIEYLYKLAVENNCDISCFKIKIFEENKMHLYRIEGEEIKIYEGENIVREYSENGTFLYSSCNKLYSKNLFKNNKFKVDIRYSEDTLFNYRMMIDAKRLVMSNLQKYNYFINNESTVKNLTEKRLDILKVQKEIYLILNEKFGDYFDNISSQYVRSSLSIVYDICNYKLNDEYEEMLHKIKKVIKEDRCIFKSIAYTNFMECFEFNLLRISPRMLIIFYKLKRCVKAIKNKML